MSQQASRRVGVIAAHLREEEETQALENAKTNGENERVTINPGGETGVDLMQRAINFNTYNGPAVDPKYDFSESIFRLDEKVALITGGARGIGFEVAKCFASVGCSVVITATTQKGAEKSAKKIRDKTGGKAVGIQADCGSMEGAQKGVSTCLNEFGGLHILVNNAGILVGSAPIEDIPVETWEHVHKTNGQSVFFHAKAVIPIFKKQKWGRIINMSSCGAPGVPGLSYYCMTKAYNEAMAAQMAKELAQYRVTANAIRVGNVLTDIWEGLDVDFAKAIIDEIPLKRPGTVREIAGLCVYLASEISGYMTGQVLVIEGGMNWGYKQSIPAPGEEHNTLMEIT